MALATASDVEARLGRPLTAAETPRVEGLLEDASALVLGHLAWDEEPSPLPGEVRIVVSRMVARVLERDAVAGVESETQTTGPFGRTLRFTAGATSGGPWLAAADKVILRRHRAGGGLTAVTVSTGRSGAWGSP